MKEIIILLFRILVEVLELLNRLNWLLDGFHGEWFMFNVLPGFLVVLLGYAGAV